jgi:hypothetical protein
MFRYAQHDKCVTSVINLNFWFILYSNVHITFPPHSRGGIKGGVDNKNHYEIKTIIALCTDGGSVFYFRITYLKKDGSNKMFRYAQHDKCVISVINLNF